MDDITIQEVIEILNQLKDKAPGEDNINLPALKHLPSNI
jgi:hypothetical protein